MHAQQPVGPLPGYASATAARERQVEAAALASPTPESAAVHARALAAEPHVAGTAAQARTRDYVVAQMRRWGLQTEVRAYDVYMPHPTGVRVWRVAPDTQEIPLSENPPASLGPEVPVFNGSGAAGDVSGEVVYVGWGLAEDYAVLDRIGVSVRGRVALARYGRSFRGIKAREAERRGVVALLIYSDPQDDGYVRGDVYPEGPMRPPRG
ncbi:MAG TPA: PA domain-containing protein, partial [Gemmatimonadaceae bacterium]|nr:PA domain-containing protein [Gemmatimonadaceae bacterium]